MPEWLIGMFAQVRTATPVIAFASVVVTAVLLFAPGALLEKLSLSRLSSEFRETIGLAFVVSSALFLTQTGSAALRIAKSAWAAVTARKADERRLRERAQSLHSLTIEEQSYLALFVTSGQTSIRIPLTDGIAGGLRSKGILYISAEMGSQLQGHDHSIEDWARGYLIANPNLLSKARAVPRFRNPYATDW